ncbi:MAG: hypothetical protein KJ926_03125, partial [Candidatus Omnitrophica bacterium]|nr:hypothetical protein [Candidatus Omnitrophota bacterium]
PIFLAISQQNIFTGFTVALMTIVIFAGLILKPRKKTRLGLSSYALWLVVIFIIGAYVSFILGIR